MTDSPWIPRRGEIWRSGRWAVELRDDEAADIRYDGALVARSVRSVLRDRDWGTVPVTVAARRVGDDTVELALRYDGLGVLADAVLRLRTSEVDGAGRLEVSTAITVHTAFERARIGLVLLHPPTVAGSPLRVEHPDGGTEQTAFPDRISPHQPALDIAGLGWRIDGVEVHARLSGEVFEMEDQRNWTDASFKTYSTPLALPFPVAVTAGAVIEQSIAFEARRVAPTASAGSGGRSPASATTPVLRLRDAGREAPEIVVAASTAPDDGREHAAPPASAVLVELDAAAANRALVLARAASAGLPLDVRIVADAPERVEPVVAELARSGARVLRLGVHSATTHVSEPELVDALRAAAAAHGIAAPLVGGARSHFTELNRTHERLPRLDAVAFAVTPQMHATETFQLEESIGMQRRVAADAVAIAAGSPVHVGPIELLPRFNAVATTAPPAEPGDLAGGYGAALRPGTVDARQSAPELAAWTIASAAALAAGGAASLCCFEQWGPRGLESADGTPFPAREAVAALHALAGAPLLVLAEPADDARDWALGARTADGIRVLVAHLDETPATIHLEVDGARHGIDLPARGWAVLDIPTHHTTQED